MGQGANGGSRTTRRPRYNRLVNTTQKVPKRIKNIGELEKIIREKIDLADENVGTSAAEWTNALLNIVLELGRDEYGYEVWPQEYHLSARTKRNAHYVGNKTLDRGEWQFDACWTRYPELTKWVMDLRDPKLPASHSAGIELACESEWFQNRGAEKGVAAILDDFAKLVESRARFKLMFFDYRDRDGFGSYEDIKKLCEKLIKTDNGGGHYLLMAWPDDTHWDDRLKELRIHRRTAAWRPERPRR